MFDDADVPGRSKGEEKAAATYRVKYGKNVGTKLKKLSEGCQ